MSAAAMSTNPNAPQESQTPLRPRKRQLAWAIPGWILFTLHTLSYFYYGDNFSPNWGTPIAIIVAIIVIACGIMGHSIPLIAAGIITPFIIWVIMAIGVAIGVVLMFLQAIVNVISTAITGSPAIEGTLAT